MRGGPDRAAGRRLDGRILTPARAASASALLLVACLAVLVGASPAHGVVGRTASVTARAAAGRNGWYWPTGTEHLGTMGGWMDYRSSNRSWHLAKDIGASKGSPVFALSDGVVFSAYSNLAGYGPGGGPGGAIVLLLRRDDGSYFKALYGHLYGLKYSKGQTVKAGAVLGYVNDTSPNHLHFGIHPGASLPTDPQHNAFRGHTYVKSLTYGWTDPVAFLETHGPYVPPSPVTLAVPSISATVPAGTIASVTTTLTPAHGRDCTVRLERYRLERGDWVLCGSSRMTPGRGVGIWAGGVMLGAGNWRLRACFSGDFDHLAGSSGYATVTSE